MTGLGIVEYEIHRIGERDPFSHAEGPAAETSSELHVGIGISDHIRPARVDGVLPDRVQPHSDAGLAATAALVGTVRAVEYAVDVASARHDDVHELGMDG